MKNKISFLLASLLAVSVFVYTRFYLLQQSTDTNNVLKLNRHDSDTPEIGADKTLRAYKNTELYLRMTTAKSELVQLYNGVLVQSMKYFWSDAPPMVVVLDQENKVDHAFGESIRKTFPFPRICFMDPVRIRMNSGKARMERDMMYPERCISKEYVAFIDTDTMFITRVVPEHLFVDGKPVIIGIYGNETNIPRNKVAESTAKYFKTKEVMNCMSYFPVILKIKHIVETRKYLEKLHNMSYDEFRTKMNIRQKRLCQYNLMCQYVWMFHRDEYHFRLQFCFGAVRSTSAREDSKYYDKMLTEEQKLPIARVSAHYKTVLGNWKNQNTYRDLLTTSICFSGGFDLCPEKCKKYRKSSLWAELFTFQRIVWTWDNRCKSAQEEHFKKIAKYASSKYTDIIRKACNEVDTLMWPVPSDVN